MICNLFFVCFFRGRQLEREGKKNEIDNEDDFGLSEDYDYEVDDNADKFKTLTDKTLLYFIENYQPDKNNSELVRKKSLLLSLLMTCIFIFHISFLYDVL
jgi:hypothetical protein